MPKVSWWYPAVDLSSSKVYRYQARRLYDSIPAVSRPEFLTIVKNVRRTGGVVVGAALETFGATMPDFSDACDLVERAGGRLFIEAELQGQHVREAVNAAHFQKLLGNLSESTHINIRPISQCRNFEIPRSSYITNESPGKYHIYLMEDAPPEVLAHEIMHVVLDEEGYPVFTGASDAGLWESALADVEIEARLQEQGFTDGGGLESRCREIAARPLISSEFEWRVVLYVTYSLYRFPHSDSRDHLRSRIREEDPQAAEVGEVLIRLIDHGLALRNAETATVAYNAVADYLGRAGLAMLTVTRKQASQVS